MTDKMQIRRDGALGWLVFNNPERHNAVSLAMWEAIPALMEELEQDPEIRVILVTGAGGKAFVSGADISEFEESRNNAAAARHYHDVSEGARERLHGARKPTVAVIDGYCIGGGLAIALMCDLRIASDASRFGIPAARLGIGYGAPGIRLLMDVVGPAAAREIMYTARRYDAAEALGMGLVNRVFPAASFQEAARDYAGAIAGNAPLTVAAAKRAIGEWLRDEGERDLAAVERMVDACADSADYAEGRRAFLEKRKPAFSGV